VTIANFLLYLFLPFALSFLSFKYLLHSDAQKPCYWPSDISSTYKEMIDNVRSCDVLPDDERSSDGSMNTLKSLCLRYKGCSLFPPNS